MKSTTLAPPGQTSMTLAELEPMACDTWRGRRN